MDVPVSVTVGDRTTHARTDRSGYLDVVIPEPGFEPGWHTVTIEAEGAKPVPAWVLIIDREASFGLVSDIDDTVISTSLPRPLIAAWNTFVRQETARHLVPGMAPMYRTLLGEHPGSPIFYLSTGAWNTAPTLTRFLKRHGYPAGPMLMTDWGPTNTGWFRSGQEHKTEALHRLAREFPRIRWVLIGDDGQHDPKIYGDFARDRPDVVEAIGIRELTPAEQVLARHTGVQRGVRPAGAARRAGLSCTRWLRAAPPAEDRRRRLAHRDRWLSALPRQAQCRDDSPDGHGCGTDQQGRSVGGREYGGVGVLAAAEPDQRREGGNGYQPGRSCHRVVHPARGPGQLIGGGGEDAAGQRRDGHGQAQTQKANPGKHMQEV